MTPEEEEEFEKLALKAQRLAKEGRLSEAEALLRRVPDADRLEGYFHEKVMALIDVAAALAKLRSTVPEDLLGEAEEMASCLRRGGIWHEADALASIGDIWADLGQTSQALRVFRKAVSAIDVAHIQDDGTHSVLAHLAAKLREAGQSAEADAVEARLPEWRRKR